MAQLFRPAANLWFPLLIWGVIAALIVTAGVGYGMYIEGWGTEEGRALPQPVPFSHAHHAGDDGIDCRYCHGTVEEQAFAGMPTSETCMHCHAILFADAPALAPVRESFALDRPLAWVRVHDLADFVYFDHSAHVNKGIGCETCHGRVDRMARITQVAPLTMKWCIDCHEDPTPNLRPPAEIFTMGWTPTTDHEALTRALADLLDVRPRTSCSECHR